jgi:hypothetical protein
MGPVKINPSDMTRVQAVAMARFKIDGGRSGVFLQHSVFEVHPAPEMMPWIQKRMKRRVQELPYDPYAQCAFLVWYNVEREIYENLDEQKVVNGTKGIEDADESDFF